MNPLEVEYILRGPRRQKILKALEKDYKTVGYLAKELKVSLSNVSLTLKDLLSKKYVKCEKEEMYHYKVYIASDKGKKILEEIKKLQK